MGSKWAGGLGAGGYLHLERKGKCRRILPHNTAFSCNIRVLREFSSFSRNSPAGKEKPRRNAGRATIIIPCNLLLSPAPAQVLGQELGVFLSGFQLRMAKHSGKLGDGVSLHVQHVHGERMPEGVRPSWAGALGLSWYSKRRLGILQGFQHLIQRQDRGRSFHPFHLALAEPLSAVRLETGNT